MLCLHSFSRWRYQAITWPNVDLSVVKSNDIHLRAISQEIPQPSITKLSLIITYGKFHWNLPGTNEFTHFPLEPHICASESGQHWFRQWLVAYSAPSHYLKQCWVIVNWTLRNKLQWNFNQNIKRFIHKKSIWKYCLRNGSHLVKGEMSWTHQSQAKETSQELDSSEDNVRRLSIHTCDTNTMIN